MQFILQIQKQDRAFWRKKIIHKIIINYLPNVENALHLIRKITFRKMEQNQKYKKHI